MSASLPFCSQSQGEQTFDLIDPILPSASLIFPFIAFFHRHGFCLLFVQFDGAARCPLVHRPSNAVSHPFLLLPRPRHRQFKLPLLFRCRCRWRWKWKWERKVAIVPGDSSPSFSCRSEGEEICVIPSKSVPYHLPLFSYQSK